MYLINFTVSLISPASGPSLPQNVEHPLLSDTEVQKPCSHVSNCGSQPSHQCEDTRSRSLVHSSVCKKHDYFLKRSWYKHPSSPPKAIVTPLKTNAVDASEYSENIPSCSSDSHDIVHKACECHSKKVEATCDLKSNTRIKGTIDEWKILLEAKDKMLAQKNDLIER